MALAGGRFDGALLVKRVPCKGHSAFSFQLGIIGKALSYWRGVLSKVVHIRHQASQNAKTNRPGLITADTVYILINLKLSAAALLLSVADFRMEGPSQGRIPPLVGSSSLPLERGQSIPLFRRARLFWERGQSTPLSQRARGLGCFWPIVCVWGVGGVWGACAGVWTRERCEKEM